MSELLDAVQSVIYVNHVKVYSAMTEMCLHELRRRAHSVGPEMSLAPTEFLHVPSHSHHHAVIVFVSRTRLESLALTHCPIVVLRPFHHVLFLGSRPAKIDTCAPHPG